MSDDQLAMDVGLADVGARYRRAPWFSVELDTALQVRERWDTARRQNRSPLTDLPWYIRHPLRLRLLMRLLAWRAAARRVNRRISESGDLPHGMNHTWVDRLLIAGAGLHDFDGP